MWLALVSGWLNFFSQQKIWWVNCCSIAKLCMTLCNPVKCSTPGFPGSPSPGACSNSCPLNQQCHPTISSSVIPFSSCPQSCLASESFPKSQLFASGGQSIGASASAPVLLMNIPGWFPLGLTDFISFSPRNSWDLLRHYNSKASVIWHSSFFMLQLSHPYITTGKIITMTRWNLTVK